MKDEYISMKNKKVNKKYLKNNNLINYILFKIINYYEIIYNL